jgi:hypothetical protein
MKYFLIKVSAFGLLSLGLLFLLSTPITFSDEALYIKGIKQKHDRLDSLKFKRIILAGGSNVAFGIDSKIIQDTLKRPVVNLAIHAGLGLDFIINELSSVVDSGDIIFLCPEYLLKEGRIDLQQNAMLALSTDTNYVHHNFWEITKHTIQSKFDQVLYNKDYLLTQMKYFISKQPKTTSVYSNKAFNSYGDVVSHLDKTPTRPLTGKVGMSDEHWDGIEKINLLADQLQRKGAKIYYLYPTYCATSFQYNVKQIKKLQGELQQLLKIPILNEPEDFIYNDDMYFDTVYHLNKDGRDKRTQDLLKILLFHKDIFH